MKMSGAEILIASLIEQGAEIVFGYPGGAVIDIYDAFYERRDEISHVLASHEQGAIHAADGYARATRQTGVAVATSGPGATNLVTGIATAYLDSIPVVAVTGNVSQQLLGKDSFQEVDIVGVTIPITKHSYLVKNAEEIPEIVKAAFTIANSNRPGPVLIDIPKDVQQAKVEYVPAGKYSKRRPITPDANKLDEIAAAINKAKKPMIYFGGGIKIAHAEAALKAFAEKIGSPMGSTIMGLAAVNYDNPLYLGMLGMHGRSVCNKAMNECDLLIAVGARFSDRITGNKDKFASEAKIIHIDMDISEINKNITAHIGLQSDAREALEALMERVEQRDHSQWLDYLHEYEAATPNIVPEYTYGADPLKVIKAVADISQHEALIVTDVGQHQMLVAQNYEFTEDSVFASSCGCGTMGYGMGAANGIQMAYPNRRVVLFTGDGCFHMNFNELAVAVTEKLPIIVIVMNNSVLGMVRQWQKLFYKERYSSTVLNRQTDFVKLAEALGAKGMRINDDSEIDAVLKEAMDAGGPVVIDCIVDKDYGAFPFIPGGKAFEDTIFSNPN